MDIVQEVLQAEYRIRPYIRETPLEYSFPLSKLTGGRVFLKLENLQYTGSFKVRGAMNALLSLTPEQRTRGVVTASSGNHGIAVAFGLHTLKMQGTIFVPEETSSVKIAAIRNYGADIRFWGTDSVVTETYARSYAAQYDMVYISPYNDVRVVGGQGTIGVEVCQRLVDDYMLVSEDEIRRAMRLCIETHHMLIEGAAGVPLAALLKTPQRFREKTVVVVLCGANLSLETLKTIL